MTDEERAQLRAEVMTEARIVLSELDYGIKWLAKCWGKPEQEIRDKYADLVGNPRTPVPPKTADELFAEAMGTRGGKA